MAIEGKKREQVEFKKKVGLTEVRVMCINPSAEDYDAILGIEIKEDSKATEYLGETNDGNLYLRIAIWVEDVNTGDKYSITFFLEDKERENKEGTKKQYINAVGACSWADDPNNLPEWFVKREYRVAYTGEEELYEFLRTWLGNLDYRAAETTLDIDVNWKAFKKGNVKDLRSQINGEWCVNFVALVTIVTKERNGEPIEYQGIYNKAFLPVYSLKYFRLIDYSSKEVLDKLRVKKPKELKFHEKFVMKITDPEYGCRDFYILKDIEEYDSSKNIVTSDKVIDETSSEY